MSTTKPLVQLTSFVRHQIEAYFNWIVENDLTPHILFLMDPEAQVNFPTPAKEGNFIAQVVDHENKQIATCQITGPYQVVNISYKAAPNISFGEDDISATARFSGKSGSFHIPYDAIISIYSRERNEADIPLIHHFFPLDLNRNRKIQPEGEVDSGEEKKTEKKDRSHLSVVK